MTNATKSSALGIMSALPQEMEALLFKMTNQIRTERGKNIFISGTIGAVPIVATLSGMGKVNAAISAQRLISDFNVRAIIFSGVAGGINENFEIGDLVIAESTFQHDYGHAGDSFQVYAPGTMPQIGIGSGSESINYNLTEVWPTLFFPWVVKIARKVEKKFSPVVVNGKSRNPNVHTGVVATGDQFISQPEKKNIIAALGADAVEMEGGAVAQVAAQNEIALLLIRSLSDKAGSEAHLDFNSFLPAVSANNVRVISAVLTDPEFSTYFPSLITAGTRK